MSELRELYQSVILDHNKKPRNLGLVDCANRSADGHNPLCGDVIHLTARVDEGGLVEDLRFEGQGCAISTASASLMTQAVKGRSVDEARTLFADFREMVTGDPTQKPDSAHLGKLVVFGGVREFPMRVKCATLAWHTLANALDQSDTTAKTE
jgi:nitrogen fixation NifU-like protein